MIQKLRGKTIKGEINMEFSISKNILVDALTKVSKYTAKSNAIPILGGIYVEAKNNTVILVGSNKESTIQMKIDSQDNLSVEKEGAIVIPKTISDIVRKLPNGEICFKLQKKGLLDVSTKNSKFSLNTLSSEEYPNFEQGKFLFQVGIEMADLIQAVEGTYYCAATDDARPALRGIEIKITNKKIAFSATNGHLLSQCRIALENETNEEEKILQAAIVPAKWIHDAIKNFTNDTLTLGFEENAVTLFSTTQYIKTQLIEGNFPDFKPFLEFPQSIVSSFTTNKAELIKGLEQVDIICSTAEPKAAASIMYENSELILSNNNKNQGEVVIKTPTTLNGDKEDIKVGFNVNYLLNHLKSLSGEEVTLGYIGDIKPIILNGNREEEFKLMLPVRLG
ncbi:DNA polymerase III subunit beta [Bacillus paranthracis]